MDGVSPDVTNSFVELVCDPQDEQARALLDLLYRLCWCITACLDEEEEWWLDAWELLTVIEEARQYTDEDLLRLRRVLV